MDLYQLFVDFKQVYDSVNRNKLLDLMRDLSIPPKLVRLVEATMQDSQCRVKVMGDLTNSFKVTQGLKQGDGLAPIFNLALEKVVRSKGVDTKSTVLQKSQQIAGYADDLNILGRSIPAIKEAFGSMVTAAKIGLRVNEDKTRLLLQTRKRRAEPGQTV